MSIMETNDKIDKKTFKERSKEWIKEHPVEITVTILVLMIAIFYGAFILIGMHK